ncbi:hypothetical protein EDC94DRAFT_629726 [Helicostylum pulchrum]|nr:hypothetical protein EDC94DRAFT_629726 [Helicostylum pulchrum]
MLYFLSGRVNRTCTKNSSKTIIRSKQLELLQRMVKILRENNLCEKVFVSPVCLASSEILKRDTAPTTVTSKLASLTLVTHKLESQV